VSQFVVMCGQHLHRPSHLCQACWDAAKASDMRFGEWHNRIEEMERRRVATAEALLATTEGGFVSEGYWTRRARELGEMARNAEAWAEAGASGEEVKYETWHMVELQDALTAEREAHAATLAEVERLRAMLQAAPTQPPPQNVHVERGPLEPIREQLARIETLLRTLGEAK
jgi:hypothetical protein